MKSLLQRRAAELLRQVQNFSAAQTATKMSGSLAAYQRLWQQLETQAKSTVQNLSGITTGSQDPEQYANAILAKLDFIRRGFKQVRYVVDQIEKQNRTLLKDADNMLTEWHNEQPSYEDRSK